MQTDIGGDSQTGLLLWWHRRREAPTAQRRGKRGNVLIVDIVLIVVLAMALAIGFARGLLATLGGLLGLVGGGIAAYWLLPLVSGWTPWPQWRAVTVIAAAAVLLVVGALIGSAFGRLLRRGATKIKLRTVDRLLGAAGGTLVAALAIALVAPTITMTGLPIVSTALASSRVVQIIDSLTPDPVNAVFAEIRGAALDDGLPRFGELLSPGGGATADPIVLDDPALTRSAASVARISGIAYACGVTSTGSGFVVAPERIVTNAHVVAGVDAPVVELPGRRAHDARVVYFDPVDDLAVLAVDGLEAAPIDVVGTLDPGTAAVVQGYPYGGPFTSSSAIVSSVGTVPVPDIYEESANAREIYSLDAEVRPGNSGGPLLTAEGDVAGVVFARGQENANRGYAMTVAELAPVLDRLPALDAAVPTGRCTS